MTLKPQPSRGFSWLQAAGGPALRCRALDGLADHIFTTRAWRLASTPHSDGDGWAEVAGALHVDAAQLARLQQVHGAAVVVATAGGAAPCPAADIHVTDDRAIALAVQTADCVPILLADPRTGAVGAAHAGWRGLAARVPEVAVAALGRQFGARPSDLVVAIGPAIGACCYEVGLDVRDAFRAAGFGDDDIAAWFFGQPQPSAVNPTMAGVSSEPRANHWFFDGWMAARHQLQHAGVPADRIHVAGLCTGSHPDVFCSYRRDGRPAGRMAAAIRRR